MIYICMNGQPKKRIVVNTSTQKNKRVRKPQPPAPREHVVALTVIGAAALATFVALFITSRPYDPMNSTLSPQAAVPSANVSVEPSPRSSPTAVPTTSQSQIVELTPEPAQVAAPDDADIKTSVERAFAADPKLSDADITAVVENGRVTLVGAVETVEVKQRAEKVVRSIAGVTSVNNQLTIPQTTPP